MTRILLAFVLAVFGTLSVGAENAPDPANPAAPKLANGAPNQHVVVRGDTLWDISAKFLQEPWRWPEIWRANQDRIKNPHRIYPGDVIVLERDANGNPVLRLDPRRRSSGQRPQIPDPNSKQFPQVHEETLADAIPPIPPNVIEPFIAAPMFVERNTLQSAPRIVATQESRVFLGKGDTAYVGGADPEQKEWLVFRNGSPVYDPENGRLLGYEAFHLGSVKQVDPGNPAVFEVLSTKQEMGYGDRLVPATRPRLVDYVPHAPDRAVDGRVVSVYGGIGSGGRLSIVMINRGEGDGLEIGSVLALERNRVVEQRGENDRIERVVIPPKRFGLIFVFRTFAHVSYALVVQSDGIIEVNDFIRSP